MIGRSRAHGFGLIEVVLATTLLALGLIGHLALQGGTLRAEARARALVGASEHARSELALARALPGATRCVLPLPAGVTACRLSRSTCQDSACLAAGGVDTISVETETATGQQVRLVTLQRRLPGGSRP